MSDKGEKMTVKLKNAMDGGLQEKETWWNMKCQVTCQTCNVTSENSVLTFDENVDVAGNLLVVIHTCCCIGDICATPR